MRTGLNGITKAARGLARAFEVKTAVWLRDPDHAVSKILDELKKLAAQTDPGAGTQSSFEKNLKSQRALGLANNLIAIVAGWAIDHQAGLVKDGLKSMAGAVPELCVRNFQFAYLP